MTIPASNFVQVNPAVIGAGGAALDLNGLLLTTNTAIPMGTVQSFPNATAVGNFFGPTSEEAQMAAVYFLGYDNKTQTPGALLMAQHAVAAVSGYLRSGSIASMTLTELQALSGLLTITVDGTAVTSSSINLSSATSFSNAATIIAAGFSSLGAAWAYDSVRQAFTVTSNTTGASSSVSFASNTLSAGLLLTQATGAVLSAGSALQTPATIMASVMTQSLNWATFSTVYEPDTATKLLFSAWNNSQNNRFAYIGYDSDVTPTTTVPATESWMYQVTQAGYSGTFPVYLSALHAAFVMGMTASINFSQTNGRLAYQYKYQSGLLPSVSDPTIEANLIANGYNFIATVATANQGFTFLFPGTVSGPYLNMAPYVNQIYLNSQLQIALLELLTTINSIPYNTAGSALIASACADPITQAVNFGTIRAGVALSALQIAEVNNAAGVAIDSILSTRGWYLQILPATAQVRAAGGTPPISLWYMDGGDVRYIAIASIVIQ